MDSGPFCATRALYQFTKINDTVEEELHGAGEIWGTEQLLMQAIYSFIDLRQISF